MEVLEKEYRTQLMQSTARIRELLAEEGEKETGKKKKNKKRNSKKG